jgi:transposase-like protein
MNRQGRHPQELREWAVRMVFEHQGEHPSQWAAICSIAAEFGISHETLRNWVRRAETDEGLRPGFEALVAGRRGVLRSPLLGLPAGPELACPASSSARSRAPAGRRQLPDARAVATSRPRVRPRRAADAATTRRSPTAMLARPLLRSCVQVSG